MYKIYNKLSRPIQLWAEISTETNAPKRPMDKKWTFGSEIVINV